MNELTGLEVSDPQEDAAALQARLQRSGYLFFRSLLPLPLIEAVALRVKTEGEALRLFETTRPPILYRDPDFVALQQMVLPSVEVAQLAADAQLLGVLQLALGGPAQRRFADICRIASPLKQTSSAKTDSCLLKQTSSVITNGTTPPHQDGHYLKTGEPHFLISWLPLVDCPLELGPLAVLPGSQLRGLLPHVYCEASDAEEACLTKDAPDEAAWATAAMRRGDVLLFTALTVHRALPNQTAAEFRLSIDFRWSAQAPAVSHSEPVLHDHRV